MWKAAIYRVLERADGQGGDFVQGGLFSLVMTKSADEAAAYEAPLPPSAHETTTQTGIPNEIGVLTWAHDEPGTARSEFFINITDNPLLDAGEPAGSLDRVGYATFGRVLRGMRILEDIQQMPADAPVEMENLKGQILSKPVTIIRAYRVNQ